MTENSSADAVQSHQAGFVRCCPSIFSSILHIFVMVDNPAQHGIMSKKGEDQLCSMQF